MLSSLSVLITDPSRFALTPALFLSVMGILILFVLALWYLMQPKYFYVIRHGETLQNKEQIKQGAEGALSPEGVKQAQLLGKALSGLRIGELCTSPYERAVETARLMQEELKAKIITTPLLAERKSPSEVIGKRTDDPTVKQVTGLTADTYHADSYRFSDEENFEDLKTRARECLRYLERRPAHRVVVITHHAFLHMLLSYMEYRDELDATAYAKLSFFNPVDNGAISLCAYYPWHGPLSKTRGWQVITYNQVVAA